ncbi:MAG: methylated-DNA--[protein]-cysteine S-methyltransferase [Steroidobacteraceae bacterium]
MICWHEIESPVGTLLLAGDGRSLRHVHFQVERRARRPDREWVHDPRPFAAAVSELDEYFAGRRRDFDLPLAPEGTEFQRTVWRALGRIPYGETVSYGELARRIGSPRASRAVGLANGANPIPIIVPCHRVIGADGSLTGFGGGLEIKGKLLALERTHAGERQGAQTELFGCASTPTSPPTSPAPPRST